MVRNFYFRIPKRVRVLILFLLIILVAYFVLRFLPVKPASVPQDFLKARQEASLIAQQIVSLSGQTAGKLGDISQLDRDRKYTEALTAVSQEIERNKKARDRAISLSKQLEIMAKNLSQIYPASASQMALQAISSETALITQLINYNDYLMQLLGILQDKFLGKSDGNKIPDLIQKINNEAQGINSLNQKFEDTMKNFDSSL